LYADDANGLGKCSVFTPQNIWNTPIDKLPVAPSSALHISTVGLTAFLHPDFGASDTIGIPVNVVPNDKATTNVNVHFQIWYESDRSVYPIPANPLIENGANSTGDRHVIIVDKQACILYELIGFYPPSAAGQPYTAYAGAVFNLNWDELRPETFTSADAAGLPIFPGLVRYDEVASGEIDHALRVTVPNTQEAYLWPARHYASKLTDAMYMPMGTRLRLKASVDISKFSKTNQVILKALKKYGMMVADNGTAWYITGAPDSRWNDGDLHNLQSITGADFEEVDVSGLAAAPDSAETIPGAAQLRN
jgi:hypothetical protein